MQKVCVKQTVNEDNESIGILTKGTTSKVMFCYNCSVSLVMTLLYIVMYRLSVLCEGQSVLSVISTMLCTYYDICNWNVVHTMIVLLECLTAL